MLKLSVSRKKENQKSLEWHEGDLFPEQLLLYINVHTDIFYIHNTHSNRSSTGSFAFSANLLHHFINTS